MHLPRDPGEWAFMAALMAAFMAVAMLAAHGVRSHLTGHASPMRPGMAMSVAGSIVRRLLALGVPLTILGPMMLLTVPGRQTGRSRTLPVDVHVVEGRRYLIATHGLGSWVLNLRAANRGTLSLGRRRVEFRPRELGPEEAGAVIREALSALIASNGWRGRGVRGNLGVEKDSPDADYVRAARDHPVFEVQPIS